MKALAEAIATIAVELHSDRIDAICSALESASHPNVSKTVSDCLGSSFSNRMQDQLQSALLQHPSTSVAEVVAMFRTASATSAIFGKLTSVELVWTGPTTGMVPVRHTTQVLTGLIDEARERLFLVSFVAYNVGSVINALQRAVQRGVRARILLERSKEQGGTVSVDSMAMLKQSVPGAHLFEWDKSSRGSQLNASVHAKCAVADGSIAFVTSANLSDAAMERNMELGVLLRGGHVPRLLDEHLAALVTTKQLRAL